MLFFYKTSASFFPYFISIILGTGSIAQYINSDGRTLPQLPILLPLDEIQPSKIQAGDHDFVR